eukprot:GEMP01041591.1.p1 GENE.GEMP01041591.1~~GEMP01041591.1.p1  ORF type:complete len:245 (+),score=36.55 GEMP01041591.1:273-1007(+)
MIHEPAIVSAKYKNVYPIRNDYKVHSLERQCDALQRSFSLTHTTDVYRKTQRPQTALQAARVGSRMDITRFEDGLKFRKTMPNFLLANAFKELVKVRTQVFAPHRSALPTIKTKGEPVPRSYRYSSRCHPLGLRYCQPPKPLSSTLPLTRHGNSVLRQWENLAPEEREAVWLDPSSHWYNSPCGSSTVATSSSRRVSSHLSRSNSDMVGTQKISSSVASLEGEYEAGSDEEAAVLPPVSVASDV